MKPGGRFITAGLGLVLCAPFAPAALRDDERILSATELKAMEREDGMWRVLHVDEDLPACLDRLRAAGFKSVEVDAFQPRLREIWETTAERNFGWLQEEAVEKIQDVDREFIGRIRAARLREIAGLALPGFATTNEQTLNRQWRQALLRVLDYDEIAEFRLMNSAAAREAGRRLQGIAVTADEQRVLYQGERDFARDYGQTAFELMTPERVEAELDHFTAVREVLGPERCAIYLERAAPDFAQMREALAANPPASAGAALDLWWLRKRYFLATRRQGSIRPAEWQAELADFEKSAQQLLGDEKFAAYVQREEAWWLRQRWTPRTAKLQPAKPAGPAAP